MSDSVTPPAPAAYTAKDIPIGTRLPIPDDQKKIVKQLHETLRGAESGLRSLSFHLNDSQRLLWDHIHSVFPGLAGRRMSLSDDSGTVTISDMSPADEVARDKALEDLKAFKLQARIDAARVTPDTAKEP